MIMGGRGNPSCSKGPCCFAKEIQKVTMAVLKLQSQRYWGLRDICSSQYLTAKMHQQSFCQRKNNVHFTTTIISQHHQRHHFTTILQSFFMGILCLPVHHLEPMLPPKKTSAPQEGKKATLHIVPWQRPQRRFTLHFGWD